MAGEATGGREELILLGFWSSPFVMRARFVLNLKGLPYEYVEEDLFNNKSQLLLASNPVHKKVPVLIHNGKPVCESMVIMQYIDEAFPSSCPRFLPTNPHERAAARCWAAIVDDKLFSTWIPVYNGRTVEDRVEAARQLIAVLQMFERAFRECSNGKAFFGGDSVGLVDVVLGSFLGWLNASEAMCGVKVIDSAKTPLLAAWAERFGALDGVKEVMPDTQRLVEYKSISNNPPKNPPQKTPFRGSPKNLLTYFSPLLQQLP